MLFNSIADGRPGVEIEQVFCILREEVDVARFKQAWALAVERHAILRTRFRWHDVDEPRQEIVWNSPLRWEDFDWSGLPADEREARWRELVDQAWLEGFDLAAAPPMRFALVREGPRQYRFCWSHHHALVDGRSYIILWNEIITTYDALAAGGWPALEPARPFTEHAEWLNAQDWSGSEAFWRARLSGMDRPTPVPILFAQPRMMPDLQLYGDQQLTLSPAQTSLLRSFAVSQGATLTTLVQAAWSTLLSRYSGASDVMFGTIRAGRRSAGTVADGVAGPFITTVPVRATVPDEIPLRAWLTELRQQWVELRPHEQVPLALVQKWSDVPPDQSLFATLLNVQDPPWDTILTSPRGRWDNLEFSISSHPDYPLALDVSAAADVRLRIFYDRRRLDDEVAGRVLRHMRTILDAMPSHAELPSSALPILDDHERDEIGEWNRTTRSCPLDRSIHALFEAQAGRRPDARAVTFGSDGLSYGELNIAANRLARRLVANGVGPGALVGICAERSVEAVIGFLAILKAGGAYVPLDPGYPVDRLAFMIADAGLSLVLTQARWRRRLPETGLAIVDLSSDQTVPDSDVSLPASITGNDRAYVIYTSGSTGMPKGVIVPHRAVVRLVLNTDYVDLGTGDRIGHASNLSFDAATFELWGALLTGAELVGIEQDTLLSPPQLARHLSRHGITTLFLTTALFNLLAREAPAIFRGMRQLLFGGEQVDPKWVREVLSAGPPDRLLHVYGPTETTTFATWFEVRDVGPAATTIPIGRPLANTRAYVVDRGGQLAPAGVPGELWIGGEAVALGYLNRPELTDVSFRPDPFAGQPGARCYRTGDIVRWLDGHLEFLGRVDHQVKVRGFRVELGEIEAALSAEAGVREAVALVREDSPGDRRLVAYVTTSGVVDTEDLRRRLGHRLPAYMLPAAIVRLDALPLTANGKVDRQALPQPARAAAPLDEPGESLTPVEQQVADIWSAVLGCAGIRRSDHFLELGGDSLLALKVVLRVNKALNLGLPVSALLQHLTLERFADAVQRSQANATDVARAPIARADDREHYPLSFFQERVWRYAIGSQDPRKFVGALPFAVRGSLDVEALRRSLEVLMARHEALRTGFAVVDGQPAQFVRPAERLELFAEDLSSCADRQDALDRLYGEEVERGLDLSQDGPCRFRLVRFDAARHLLFLTFHHLLYDATLRWVFLDELGRLYTAFSRGLSSPLDTRVGRYVDFAVWQRQRFDRKSETYQRHAEYWIERLGRPMTPLPFAFTRTQPAPPDAKPGIIKLRAVPNDLYARLKALGHAHGATLFMTLCAAYNMWLSHVSGADDIVVGTNVNQQDVPEMHGVVGVTTNLVALRTDVSGDPTFVELLARVRDATIGAFEHLEMPFELVVEALQAAGCGAPPIQTIFQVTAVARQLIPTPSSLTLRLATPRLNVMPWGFILNASEFGGRRLRTGVGFDSTIYDPEQVHLALGDYVGMLDRVTKAPERRLTEYFAKDGLQ